MMANSRRGPWEMARNLNNALPTSYWEAKGLKSLLSRYLGLAEQSFFKGFTRISGL
ncbi:hypothetical protein WJ0W_005476 [Paenibacillus melissococcoides]|uniref:Uncharacterized protein n=1 Tax=Paenibacillus melissococcoides TaxID=2912268 RepID=A0ABM9GAK7_9BACL|nr:hypothetical protein WJ0W_005476 [Paenibacillus melissococcoides]